ncbi:MAG: hypothetical protein E4H48_08550 [Syntrophobacterales bacterium]|nr:MAG: hypothetical protein E4H48_08550 [Syntrophobacterales bacterium]
MRRRTRGIAGPQTALGMKPDLRPRKMLRIRLTGRLEAFDACRAPHAMIVAATPRRYQPEATDCTCFEKLRIPEGASAAERLAGAVTFDDCLALLYRRMVAKEISCDVHELFESLLRGEQRDQVELKKIKAMDYS